LLNTLMRSSTTRPAQSRATSLLAAREAEVANLVAESLSNKEIARKLGISEHTVSNYLFRIYNKLGISSRVELVLYLMRQRESPMAAD
jgi:DNA-binding CsgD family transcriptional regulator